MNTLSQRAMLVALNFSCWLPVRTDARVTKEVGETYKVSARRAGTYKKHCIDPDAPTYKAVRRALGDMRTRFYWYTMPWQQNGASLLPATLFNAFSDDMRKLKENFSAKVDEFCEDWPRLIIKAQAELKDLYKSDDYPADIRHRFGVEMRVMPLPCGSDFRVDVGEEDVARIRGEIERETQNALQDTMREPYRRLYEHVTRMVERLEPRAVCETDVYGTDARPRVFHDSLVTGLRDLCGILPNLNLTNDPNLEAMRVGALAMIDNVTADGLRQSFRLREQVRRDADALKQALTPHVTLSDREVSLTEGYHVKQEAATIENVMSGFMEGAK